MAGPFKILCSLVLEPQLLSSSPDLPLQLRSSLCVLRISSLATTRSLSLRPHLRLSELEPACTGYPPEFEKPCSTVVVLCVRLVLPGKQVAAPLPFSPQDPSLLGRQTASIRAAQSCLVRPSAGGRLFYPLKFFHHQLLRKVNFVELPKTTLIFNYAVNVRLPPGSHYASSYCGALALNSLQIS